MNFIDQITNYIIRPSRERYHINRLGPKQIYIPLPHINPTRTQETKNYPYISIFRDDCSILTPQGRTLYYSYYTNHMTQHPDLCIIYLHANNGSRVEGLHYVEELFKFKYNVCLIDFTGSGWSEGDYVTLGCNQSHDLYTVCRHIKAAKGINHVVLWGRSMGACTALMFTSKFKDHNSIGMVLDSPFKDLRKLVKQTAKQKTGLPEFFFEPILSFVDKQLQKKIGHRFEEYQMQKYVSSTARSVGLLIPTLFISSKMDRLVKPHHVESLYENYPGIPNIDKFLHYIQNEHHQDRDEETVKKCVGFINDIVGRFYRAQKFEQGHLNGNIDSKLIKISSFQYHNQPSTVEHKYSLKTQQLIPQSQIITASKNPTQPHFSFNSAGSIANITHTNAEMSLAAKLETAKQKERKKRGGIQLTEKFHHQYQGYAGKRLSQPSISRQSYDEQRINLSKNIKIKMNQSYQNLGMGQYSNCLTAKGDRTPSDSIRMIQSMRGDPTDIAYTNSTLTKSNSKRINLSGFRSPRDKFQQYYTYGKYENNQNKQNQNIADWNESITLARGQQNNPYQYQQKAKQEISMNSPDFYSSVRTHTSTCTNFDAFNQAPTSYRPVQPNSRSPTQIYSNFQQTKSQHNLLTAIPNNHTQQSSFIQPINTHLETPNVGFQTLREVQATQLRNPNSQPEPTAFQAPYSQRNMGTGRQTNKISLSKLPINFGH